MHNNLVIEREAYIIGYWVFCGPPLGCGSLELSSPNSPLNDGRQKGGSHNDVFCIPTGISEDCSGSFRFRQHLSLDCKVTEVYPV